MLTLITYDISSQKRLNKVARACENYGIRVQNSVFECNCNYAKLKELKLKLEKIIHKEEDSVRFYFLPQKENNLEILGKTEMVEILEQNSFTV